MQPDEDFENFHHGKVFEAVERGLRESGYSIDVTREQNCIRVPFSQGDVYVLVEWAERKEGEYR